MKKIYFLFFVAISASKLFSQSICNAGGNMIIYSNYDGGVLNIDVDQNIPNLKIGVVSYEPVTINISGTFASNVTEVVYAGYVATNNHNCANSPSTTTITGVTSGTSTVNFLPAANYNNPNGYTMIICNYTCSTTTNQGGCNTPDQVVAYFQSVFGEQSGSLYYHFTQYGCWSATPYAISAGGTCCVEPTTTSIVENNFTENNFVVTPNPSNGDFKVVLPIGVSTGEIRIYNVLGEEIRRQEISNSGNVSLSGETPGIYFMKLITEKGNYSGRIILTE